MAFLQSIVEGSLWDEMQGPVRSSVLLRRVALPVLGPAFIPKGQIGRHFHAVSRNGLVLLLSLRPARELRKTIARLRLSIWHRNHLPGEGRSPWGVILCLDHPPERPGRNPAVIAELGQERMPGAVLSIDLGGQRVLSFLPASTTDRTKVKQPPAP